MRSKAGQEVRISLVVAMSAAMDGSTRKPAIASRASEPNASPPRPWMKATATSAAMAATKATSST